MVNVKHNDKWDIPGDDSISDVKIRSHLSTTTQTLYVVNATIEMGCMVTNVTFHTWQQKWQKTHDYR